MMKQMKRMFKKQEQKVMTQEVIEQTKLGCQISQATIQLTLGF